MIVLYSPLSCLMATPLKKVISVSSLVLMVVPIVTHLSAQTLHGEFTGAFRAGTPLYLFEVYGGQLRPVDTTRVASEGTFRFDGEHYPLGNYRLTASPRSWVDLYLNPEEEEVHLRFTDSISHAEMDVVASQENKAAVKYGPRIGMQFRDERETIQRLAALPEDEKESIREAKSKLRDLRRERRKLLQEIRKDYGDTFFLSLVELDGPELGSNLETNRRKFFSSGFLASNEFVGTSLIPSKLVEYLTIYTDQSADGLRGAVDEILFQAVGDEEVYGLSLDFLLVFFDRRGPDELFFYLLDEYAADERFERYFSEHTKERIAVRRMVAPGALAPDFSLPNLSGTDVTLSHVVGNNELSLLFFWRSGCPHCMEAMPEVNAIYDGYRETGFEIIGISLDEVWRDWSGAIAENGVEWLNVSDLKGWDSAAAEIYGVVQTPTFVLINRDMRIEETSSELEDVIAFLEGWGGDTTR